MLQQQLGSTDLGQLHSGLNETSKQTYSSLERSQICWTQCIGFGYDRNEIDPRAQTFHDFDIQGFQSMAGRSNEVKAGMDTEIDPVGSARLLFLQHVRLMLIV